MTGLIPREFLDELLSRTDIVELIDEQVPLKKRGSSFIACCPFHHEKTPSFNVVAKKQFYHCFGCGASGNAISFAMNYLHQNFVEAVEWLANRMGMEVPRTEKQKHQPPATDLYHVMTQVAQFYQKALKSSGQQAIEYLKNRHVSGEIALRYQLGYAPSGWHTLEQSFERHRQSLVTTGMLIQKEKGGVYDRYRHRIIFPIHDRQGRIIGFGGRALEADQQPKYLNSPETPIFQKHRELYGLYQVLQYHKKIDQILVVEGYMDVLALAQHDITNAVATLGTATSLNHIQLLNKYTKDIIFCFDGDNAGRQAAWRALEAVLPMLNQGLSASFIFLPQGQDPDSLIRAEGQISFQTRIKEAMPLHQLFFNTLTKDVDTATMSGKSQLIQLAKPYLLKIGDGPYQQLLMDELSRMTRIEPHRIELMISDKAQDKLTSLETSISRSPLRLAIALLLQNPELYAQCLSQNDLHQLDDAKHSILKKIMQEIEHNQKITTAALIETWRDTEFFEGMHKLAVWDHQVPEQAMATELKETVFFLTKQARESKIKTLLDKSRQVGLSAEERLNLQEMLKQRHHNEVS